jgi:hypothetical protein
MGQEGTGPETYSWTDAVWSNISFILVAAVATATMFPDMGPAALKLSTYGYLIMMGIAFAGTGQHLNVLTEESFLFEELIEQVSLRLLAVLTIAVLASDRKILELSTFLPLVLTKAVFWIGLLQTVCYGQTIS